MNRTSTAPVTVVMPCLNMERTLGEAIESVLQQTARPLEVLVMDDGSTDASVRIARSFGPPVRVLPNLEGCTGGARGGGTHQARGRYVTFCDADDWLVPDKLEKQLAILEGAPEETLVHTGSEIIYEGTGRPPRLRPGGDQAVGHCLGVIFERNPVCGASVMMRRSMILKLGNYDPELRGTDDYAMSLAASTRCHFVYLPDPLYRIRWHSGNMSHHLAVKTYYHWLAQEKFGRRFPEAFATLPEESVRQYMIEPVLRVVREAYWRRESLGYRRLVELARRLAPDDPRMQIFYRRRHWPMSVLRGWDRLRGTCPAMQLRES